MRFVSSLLLTALLLTACAERGTITLTPTRLATYSFSDSGSQGWCAGQLDRTPAPVQVRESELGPAEVAAGFGNSFGGSDICQRRESIVQVALVEFDLAQLRAALGPATYGAATLSYVSRPKPMPERSFSASDGLNLSNCARVVEWRAPFNRGWQRAESRDALRRYVVDRRLRGGVNPAGARHAVDLTAYLGRRPARGDTITLAFVPLTDLLYADNQLFCTAILGAFSLSVEYERLIAAPPEDP